MIKAIYDQLILKAEAALGVQALLAFPAWSRPAQVPPIAALEISTLSGAGNRIGQRNARHALGLRLYVFGANEPGLAQLLDSVLSLEAETARLEISGQPVDISFSGGQRWENQTGTAQENHGFFWDVTAAW